MIKKLLPILFALSIATSVQAQGSLLIDFGALANRHSLGSADSNGNSWDYITGATDFNQGLIGTDGVATSINLKMANFTGPGSFNVGLTPASTLGPNGNGDFAFTSVTDDAIFFTGDLSPTMTFSGLNDSLTYDFYFYGARVTTSTRTTTYAVALESVTLTTSGTGIASDGSNWNNDTVVALTDLSPTAGVIAVDLSATGGFGYVGAMSVTAVPEPATYALLFGLASLGLVMYRRRRLKA